MLSITGSKYFILYIDDLTRMIWVYFLKSKGAAETLQTFQNFKVLVEKSGDHKIRRIRCDNGKGEYDNERFRGYLIENGITYEPSAPYTQNQNGVSERMIRTIVEKARSMLHDAKLGESFWEEAVRTAVYLHARSPTKATQPDATPFEAWHQRKPSLHHLRRFGCDVYVHVPPERRTKWAAKVHRCTFLGYSDHTVQQYRVWNSNRITIITATNAAFDEQTFGNRDAKAKLRLMPDEIADGDIPGSALMLPVPTLQDHPHLHAMTGTKSVMDIIINSINSLYGPLLGP